MRGAWLLLGCAMLVRSAPALAEERSASAEAQERNTDRLGPWVPDYVRLQTGGYLGRLGVGVGYGAFDDVLNVGLLYGFTPDGGVGSVHALELMLSIRPFEWRAGGAVRIVPFYLGAGVLGTWGERFYLDQPDRYPSDYYPQNVAYLAYHLGLEVDYLPSSTVFERHGLFGELTVLDFYMDRYFRNPDTVDLVDVVGLALGYRAAF